MRLSDQRGLPVSSAARLRPLRQLGLFRYPRVGQVGQLKEPTGRIPQSAWTTPNVWPRPFDVNADPNASNLVQMEDAVRIASDPVRTEIGGHSLSSKGWVKGSTGATAIDIVVHRHDGPYLVGGVVGFLFPDGSYTDLAGERQVQWMWFYPNQVIKVWRNRKYISG